MAPIRGFEARQARVWRCRRLGEQIARQRAGDKGPAASCPGEAAQACAGRGCWPGLGAATAPRPPVPTMPQVPTRPPPWLARPGHSWVPGGTTLALVPCHPPQPSQCPALLQAWGCAVAPLQLCNPSAACLGVQQGWTGVQWGHRAMGREQKAWTGPQQRMANTGQVLPVPPCLNFPSCYWGPCESPVSCRRSLSPWPGHGRLRHSSA